MVKYQIELIHETDTGDLIQMYLKNRVEDVTTGQLENGELKLPGSIDDEPLSVSLSNVRAYLYNLSDIASEKRTVSDAGVVAGYYPDFLR